MSIHKETKKAINKASNSIGTVYFLLLTFLYAIPQLLKLPVIIINIWYIILPIVASEILIKLEMKKVVQYVTPHNYQMIEKAIKNQLILLGILYCLVTANLIITIIIICVYVYAAKKILKQLKIAANAKFNHSINKTI